MMLTQWIRTLNRWLRRSGHEMPMGGGMAASIGALTTRLSQHGIDHAFIGGVAVALRGYVRATMDLDLLVDIESADQVAKIMLDLNAETLQKAEHASNYLIGPLRVDFIHARRPYSRRMLAEASYERIGAARAKVVRVEDLIGLKLQALGSPSRGMRDREDIVQLLLLWGDRLDKERVRVYAEELRRLDDLESLYEEARSRNK